MGCSICIDHFLDDSPGNRPACLPCGHVFHVHCAKRWLDECASRPAERRGCPMCKHAATTADLITLWPSDLDDLDRLLAQRNDPESRWTAELQGVDMDQDEATELLDNLIDFDQAIQAYVMAVLGVRVVATRKAGQRAKKLIRSTATDAEVQEDLSTAMDSLQQVLESLQRQRDKLDQRYASIKRQQHRFNEERTRLRDRSQQLKELEAALDQREKTIEARADDVAKLKTQVVTEKAEVEDQRREVEAAAQRSHQEAVDSAASATRARIEARQTVAAMQLELDRMTREADDRVAEAESRQRDAEVERDATRAKSNLLADQMRELQRLNREVKAAKADEKTKRQKERADSAKELLDLKKRLARAEERLAVVASASASSSTPAPASSPYRAGSLAASRSSAAAVSPSSSRIKAAEQAKHASAMTLDDGEANRGDGSHASFGSIRRRKRSDSMASTSTTDADDSQSTSFGHSQSLSLLVEPPAALGRAIKRSGRASAGYKDEADQFPSFAGDSDGSEDFPMPGLPASRFRRTHSGAVGPVGSPTKASPSKLPPARAKTSSDTFNDDDDVKMPGLPGSVLGKARAQRTIGEELKLSAAKLNRPYGVVVGPKQKAKGGW